MIQPGQLCQMDTEHLGSYNGEIAEYVGKNPFTGTYIFRTANEMTITLTSKDLFIILPNIYELKDMIDLSLSLGDETWFKELVQQMNFIRGYQAAKGTVGK